MIEPEAGATAPGERAVEPDLTRFDLFILALSILSLLNVLLVVAPLGNDETNVILIVDSLLCLAFLADFFRRYRRAPVKRVYFLEEGGWLDLLGSLPFPGLRMARLFRTFKVARTVRGYRGERIWNIAIRNRAGSALLGAVFLTVVVLQFGSMVILRVEDGTTEHNIRSASDALWWSYVTVTTVGYGDRFPVTNAGRVVGIAMLTIGIGLFGVLTGFLSNAFLAPKSNASNEDAATSVDLRREIDELKQMVSELREQVVRNSSNSGASHAIERPRTAMDGETGS